MASPYTAVKAGYSQALGTEPTDIVRTSTVDEVLETVAWADRTGKSVIPWAGGSGQTYGYLPRGVDVLLDLRYLKRNIAHEPGDLVVTVDAGTTLIELQDALALHNQFLPLDPPEPARATIGGILATDAFGPSRTNYGSARDWLIGITVVNAQGKLVKGGGKVVKNVTGYDLPKLHVGTLGTLGVIVEATFKVAPRPDASRALLFQFPDTVGVDLTAAAQAIGKIVGETAPSLGLIRDAGGMRIAAFIYTGTDEVVESQRDLAERLAEATPDLIPIASVPKGVGRPFTNEAAPADAALVFRVAGLPATEFARHDSLAEAFAESLLRLDTFPGSGQSTVALDDTEDAVEAARKAVAWAEKTGARIAFLHVPNELRDTAAGFPLWTPLPPSLPIMRRLKQTLDPNATLNPGRFIDGL